MAALRAFEAAARLMSFSRAAAELFVTQSAISRHVRGLEDDLGVPLFRRLNRRVELTSAGAGYAATLRDAFDRIEAGTRAIRGPQPRQAITLSVLPTLAMQWLLPRLPAFQAAHPDLDLRVTMSSDAVDFGQDTVDAAIRVGVLPGGGGRGLGPAMAVEWSGVQAVRILPDVLTAVCSPALLQGHPPPTCAANLASHRLLHTATRRQAWPDWAQAAGAALPPNGDELWFGHFFMTHQAARDGRGVAVLPTLLVAEDLRRGLLVEPLGPGVPTASAYYLLHRERHGRTSWLAALRAWLAGQTGAAGS